MPRPVLPAASAAVLLSAALAAAPSAATEAVPAPAPTPAPTPVPAPEATVTRTWDFDVLLDGRPIGHHRFEVSGDAARRAVHSEAAFDVKLLGLSVYRYAFRATERWSGDCLQWLDATTDDDGQPARVRAEREGEALRIQGPKADPSPPACVMTWAYWNPEALRRQTRLLDPQTGRVDPVTITPAAPGMIRVAGRDQPGRRFHIAAPAGPVDVWTSPTGEWLGLDATVRGGRTLSYRLRHEPTLSAATGGPRAAGDRPS